MKVTKLSIITLVLISIISCDKKIELKQFDSAKWIQDNLGCNGVRKQQLPNLNDIKKQFEGIRETQLHNILGKPNKQELKERNCKSYYYYLDKGSQCDSNFIGKTPYLIVETDALNRVVLLRFALE